MKMTNVEFNALARYSNGRLMNLPGVFERLTEAQVKKLESDDWSYYHELQDEVLAMFYEMQSGGL